MLISSRSQITTYEDGLHFLLLHTYIKRSPVVYVYVSISSYTTRAYDNNNNLTFDERIEYVQEHVYVFIIPFTWGEFICILPYDKAIS